MLENRSFDHLCGFLYAENQRPKHFLPSRSNPEFNGLPPSFSNPSNPQFFPGRALRTKWKCESEPKIDVSRKKIRKSASST